MMRVALVALTLMMTATASAQTPPPSPVMPPPLRGQQAQPMAPAQPQAVQPMQPAQPQAVQPMQPSQPVQGAQPVQAVQPVVDGPPPGWTPEEIEPLDLEAMDAWALGWRPRIPSIGGLVGLWTVTALTLVATITFGVMNGNARDEYDNCAYRTFCDGGELDDRSRAASVAGGMALLFGVVTTFMLATSVARTWRRKILLKRYADRLNAGGCDLGPTGLSCRATF